jgi:quinol monooxygenase YgiN
MAVLVQFVVKVEDVDRFVAAAEKFAPMMEEMGGRAGAVYEDENEPGLVSTISEWATHDQMHEASEKYGDQFNEEAGTSGLDWATHIWQMKGRA